MVVETIFARPGLGRTLLNAVQLRDVPLVIGVVLVVAVGYVVMTLLTDVVSRIADPRLAASRPSRSSRPASSLPASAEEARA